MLQPFCPSNSFKTMNLIPCTRERPGTHSTAEPKQVIWRWNSTVWEGSHFLGFSWPWQLTNAPGGGADTHNNVDHNIFQQMWHIGLAAWVYVYYFEIQNFNEKNFKIQECTLSFKFHMRVCQGQKSQIWPQFFSQRWPGKKAWEKHTAFQISVIWKRHSFIACYALLYILLFHLYVSDIIS